MKNRPSVISWLLSDRKLDPAENGHVERALLPVGLVDPVFCERGG